MHEGLCEIVRQLPKKSAKFTLSCALCLHLLGSSVVTEVVSYTCNLNHMYLYLLFYTAEHVFSILELSIQCNCHFEALGKDTFNYYS